MKSISLAVADYQVGYTKCQDPDGEKESFRLGFTIIYHVRSVQYRRHDAACFDLTFPHSKCIIGARSSTVRFADEVRRGLKHHGDMKSPKSSSAESSSSFRSTTTSTFPKAGNRNRSSSRCTVMAATKAR